MGCKNTQEPYNVEPPERESPAHEVTARKCFQRAGRTRARKCDMSFHLKGAEYAVYERACRLSGKQERKEFFESSSNAAQALPYHADTISAAARRLERKGHFRLIMANREARRMGRCAPSRYEIVSHDEWAQGHPGECLGDVPDRRTKRPTVLPPAPSGVSADAPSGESPDNYLNNAGLDSECSKTSFESASTSTSYKKEISSDPPATACGDQNRVSSLCDVDVYGKAKALGRENPETGNARKSRWDIDDRIRESCASSPREEHDMIFCWHVFANRFRYENGFKNDPDGEPDRFMGVARASYEYAKKNWTWDDSGSPYCSIKGIVRLMTLVADNLDKGDEDGDHISARCFFAALAQTRKDLSETVEEEQKEWRRGM